MTRKLLTLCIPVREGQVLLGMKKRGFGAGKWNGFGGKLEPGETIEVAAKREVLEECGVTIQDMEEVGIHDFIFQEKPDETLEVHVFRVTRYTGDPVETDEMRPQWFREKELPFEAMWADDQYWFPLFLSGKKFRGKFFFDQAGQVLEKTLQIVD